MDRFSGYIKNIAYFIVFISFLGVILPTDKYKQYIKFVTGLIMIIIVISPVLGILNEQGMEHTLNKIQMDMNMGIIEKEKDYHSDLQLEMVMDSYKSELAEQIEHRLNDIGYSAYNIESVISTNDENFGEISYLGMEVYGIDNGTKVNKAPLITVDKISIAPVNQPDDKESSNSSESDEINIIKNYISDFYNLSVDNIYVKIKE